ncbi:MAG: universal stress protein [Myxococcota bacterium]
MKNLLVAVDGSDASLKAARQAAELARAFSAPLTVLTVVQPMIMPAEAVWAPMEAMQQAELERGQQLVAETQRALLPLPTRAVVKVGPPAEGIVETAHELGVDLVVVGSTGKGAVRRLLVGSVADRVMHLSLVPVLIVR